MAAPKQSALAASVTDAAQSGPGSDYGEVFTRRWVVDLVLDLAGYRAEADLPARRLVEPSCGTGAFLLAAVERLVVSCQARGHDLRDLGQAIRGFDVLEANANRARKAVAEVLTCSGLSEIDAVELAAKWVTTGDFLLGAGGLTGADYVVGNPPYIRLENVPSWAMNAYRRTCRTMRGRADIYVGFIERGLELLESDGTLAFICADRWMRNQYGADLRDLVTTRFAVDTVVSMHDVDAFENEVSAYPAIIVLRNKSQEQATVVATTRDFSAADARHLATWLRRGQPAMTGQVSYRAGCVDGWFNGRDLWPSGSPEQLAIIADLERRFPPLQDDETATTVGIGVATGCDDVFITTDPHVVEEDRLLPLLQARDTATGSVDWSGHYLVNPWDGTNLVPLDCFPRLAAYLRDHAQQLQRRHVAKRQPVKWYRTIDRVDGRLTERPKLVIPDLKAIAHPVLDEGPLLSPSQPLLRGVGRLGSGGSRRVAAVGRGEPIRRRLLRAHARGHLPVPGAVSPSHPRAGSTKDPAKRMPGPRACVRRPRP